MTTETTPERSPQDQAHLEVMGAEIVRLTQEKVDALVALNLSDKQVQEIARAYKDLDEETGETLDSLNKNVERLETELRDRDRAIQEMATHSRSMTETIDELRRRISELTRVDEVDSDDEVKFKDPEDGPLIDSV